MKNSYLSDKRIAYGNSIALFLCLLCFTSTVIRGQETKPKATIESLIQGLGDEDHAKREKSQEALLDRAIDGLDEVIKKVALAQKSDDPEVSMRSLELLKRIYRMYHLNEGIAEHGLTLGWMFVHDGKTLTSEPLILAVKKGSPADKCGCKSGDVIRLFQGKPTLGKNSRNLLASQLSRFKPGEEVELGLRVVNLKPTRGRYIDSNFHRSKYKSVKLTLKTIDKKGPEKPIDLNSFNKWLSDNS